MDCSSPYAMAGLIALKDRFDVAFACDTDHDRHGIVTRSSGLMNPNHYLSVAINYLFRNALGMARGCGHRQDSGQQQHDRSCRRRVSDAGSWKFRSDSSGLLTDCSTALSGSVARKAREPHSCERTAHVWTTDKDGLILGLLAAEITAVEGKDPGSSTAT